jgi:phosphoenolpyruvate---glycerone phosphotransferase subunit DhaL
MRATLEKLLDAAVATFRDNVEDLTALERAVGDADHGINMKRGFEAIDVARAEVLELPLGAALYKMGTILMSTVGGASGPLYGTLFVGFKHLPDKPSVMDVSRSFDEAVEALKKLGKSNVGEKTMLDVLVPVGETLRQPSDDVRCLLENVLRVAKEGLESTRNMQAMKGRASFLGERSIGHLDPGAMSSYLLVKTVCEIVMEFYE